MSNPPPLSQPEERFRRLNPQRFPVLPATDSTAFLIGQTIGFLFVSLLLVIFPMLAILRMARHVGIGGRPGPLGRRHLLYAPVRSRHLFHMGADQRAELRRTVPEAVRPNSGTPVAPERKANRIPAGPGLRTGRPRPGIPESITACGTGSGRFSRTYRKGKDRPGTACRHAVSRHRTRIRRRMKRQGRSRCRKRPFAGIFGPSDQRRMISTSWTRSGFRPYRF